LINTYNENREGLVKVFFVVNEEGKITSVKVGNQSVSLDQGLQFYVDDYVAEQIHKCELYIDGLTPRLRLKEGEELEIPSEVEEKEKEIQILRKRLKELNAE